MLIIITFVTFILVSTILVSAYYALTAESAVSQRLRTLVPDAGTPVQRAAQRRGPGVAERVIAELGNYGFGGNERSLSTQLSVAGIRGTNATRLFLGVRTLASFGPALFFLVPHISAGRPLGPALLRAALLWLAGHVGVSLWLRQRGKRRVRLITEALPDTLDLMVVCLEAGLGLNATIARVGEERATLDDPLGREFSQVSVELRSGRPREDTLRGLGGRNGCDDLKSLVALVIQSDRLGASMAQTLRAHADLLRTRRRQRAEEAARKLPIKMLFPLAFFILPALMIVVAGPAMLKLQDLMKLLIG